MAATPVKKKSNTVTTKSTPIWAPPRLRTAYLPDGSLLSGYHADGDEAGERRSRSGSERTSEQLTSFAMSYSSTSLQVAAKLGLGGIFNLNASAGGKAVLLDVACMTDFYEEQPAIDDLPGYGIRHGIGIRLAMSLRNMKMDTSLNYAGIAAQARMGLADVSYEVVGIGLPPDIIQSWLKSTKVSGSLADESNYLALQELLGKQIPEYLQSDRTLTPLAYTVLTTDQSEFSLGGPHRAVHFAMHSIARRQSLSETLAALEKDEQLRGSPDSTFVVMHTYRQVADVSDPTSTQRPTDAACRTANDWIRIS